jgi:hypothetical protein
MDLSLACEVQQFIKKHDHLVKNIDLPNFTIATDTANQYNRKKNIV